MQGASRQAIAATRERLDAVPVAERGPAGEQLLGVSALVGRESTLRAALTDTGASPDARSSLATRLLTGQVSDDVAQTVATAAAQRWSEPADLVEGLETLGAEGVLAGAEAEGRIDAVEEELFRFGRLLASSGALAGVLNDPGTPPESKRAILTDLLAERSEPETGTLLRHLVANPRGRRLEVAVTAQVRHAAQRREQLLADVRVPVALSSEQAERLAAALTAIYHQPVSVAVSVEPDLLGGAVVRVGDEIIDGSVATRLQTARRTLSQ